MPKKIQTAARIQKMIDVSDVITKARKEGGREIAAIRHDLGLGVRGFAKLIGCSYVNLNRVETGKVDCVNTMVLIAKSAGKLFRDVK